MKLTTTQFKLLIIFFIATIICPMFYGAMINSTKVTALAFIGFVPIVTMRFWCEVRK